MARLVLLNGPPAIGKSTLAQRFVGEHLLTLNLDLDGVRRMLGRWHEQPTEAGLLARSMALGMARVHLASRHDVVIPQYLGRPQFLHQAEQVAHDVGAVFAEFVLMDRRERALLHSR